MLPKQRYKRMTHSDIFNVPFSVGSAWVVAVSMLIGFRFSYGSVHPERPVRTLNVDQSKPTLYTWLDRNKHCELGKTRMYTV